MSSNPQPRNSSLDSGKPFCLQDLTAIICTRNAEPIIGECIGAAREAGIARILVVDGNSEDKTSAIASSLGVEVHWDEGRGLGAARNLGSRLCTSNLTLFLGPDNLISADTVSAMVTAINGPNVVAASCLTSQRRRDYWSRSANLYRKAVLRPGEAQILPTPTLYISSLLAREPYDETRKYSDDSELFERWNRVFLGRNIVVDKEVLEIGNETLRDHLRRFSYYGVSDYENFVAGKKSGWGGARKFQSLLHPVSRQIFGVSLQAKTLEFLWFLPGLLIFTCVRYLGWIRVAARTKLRGSNY